MKRGSSSFSSGAVVVVGSAALLACSALIGTPDLYFFSADADGGNGTSSSSGSTGGASSGSTGSSGTSSGDVDGGADAAPTCAPGTDFTADDKNCGACGHDCLGGACKASRCQPVELVVGAPQPWAIDVDGTSVYFSDIGGAVGNVFKVPKLAVKAGAGTPIMTTFDPLIYDLKVDATGLYVASGSLSTSGGKGVVEASNLDGTAKRVVARANVPRGLALDATNAYWVAVQNAPIIVQKAPKSLVDGGEQPPLSTPEDDADTAIVSGTRLYWTQDRLTTGKVRTCTLPACIDAVDFVSNLGGALSLAANSTTLFYGTNTGVFRIAKTATDGVGFAIATNQPQPYGIAADDNDIYWINLGTSGQSFNNGSVRHCPIKSGTPVCNPADGEVIATSTKFPRGIAMDAKAVYWTVEREGTVWRVAR